MNSRKMISTLLTFTLCICFTATGAYAAPSHPKEKQIHEQEQSEQTMEEFEISVRDDKNSKYNYTYMQNGFFYNSYIIEMGWNVYGDEYSNQTEVILNNGSAIKVYFTDTSKIYITDKEVLKTITGLLSYLKNMNTYPTIESPLIQKVVYVGDKDVSVLREEFYQSGDVCGFSALFSLLDEAGRKEWCQKIYDADKVAFFSAIIGYMDDDLISIYIDKSDKDQKTSFFSAFLNYMHPDTIKQYAEKYYASDDIARFAVIVPYMTEKEQKDWLKRAQLDKKFNFSTILSDNLF